VDVVRSDVEEAAYIGVDTPLVVSRGATSTLLQLLGCLETAKKTTLFNHQLAPKVSASELLLRKFLLDWLIEQTNGRLTGSTGLELAVAVDSMLALAFDWALLNLASVCMGWINQS